MGDEDFLPPDRPPRAPGQEPSARLTLEAYVRMRKELEQLRTQGRDHIRENAEYDSAKNEQGLMEARIRNLEHKLKDPEIIEVVDGDEVAAGMLVTLRPLDEEDPDDETYLVALSGEERAAGVRTVTATSPLGSVLIGRRVGERVTYEAPGGTFAYEVVELKLHRPAS